jgi:hypothetical protein
MSARRNLSSSVRAMIFLLRVIRWKLKQYLTRHLAPGPVSFAMAAHIGGVAGASFVYCGRCERPMAGVVYSENDQPADMLALGCTGCGHSLPVRVGVLEGCEDRPLTIH